MDIKDSRPSGESDRIETPTEGVASGAAEIDAIGFGSTMRIDDLEVDRTLAVTHLDGGDSHKLGQLKATAICGNDITSSCLYVAALCAVFAGPYAPLSLAVVAATLYLFRNVYAEVCSALPLNGGAYNALLNTTTKAKASVAACLTLLSYMATAVISASEAMHYAENVLQGLNVFWATVVLLGIFALLNVLGISESANVAVAIFITHMLTLTVLVVTSGAAVAQSPELLLDNWHAPAPGGILTSLLFGFSAALLGISGFESSANYVEEQRIGVFPKTLRNMWIAVAVFNPILSFLAMGLLPLTEVAAHKEDLLAEMGMHSVGPILHRWISIDATLVLSGAVLTSYVGVIGLVRRMSLDRCLPQVAKERNRVDARQQLDPSSRQLHVHWLAWGLLSSQHRRTGRSQGHTVGASGSGSSPGLTGPSASQLAVEDTIR